MKDLTNDINKIKKYCSDYLENTISINNTLTHQTKAAEVENIICLEKEIQVINWLENKLLCMKKNIIDRVEKSNQIKNISKIQIDKSEFICSQNKSNYTTKALAKKLQEEINLVSDNFVRKEIKPKSYIKIKHKSNLELEEDEYIDRWIQNTFNTIKRKNNYSNLNEEEVDLGFGNTYTMKTILSLDKINVDDIPYDTLIYDKHTSQVIIKVGNDNTFKIINSKLCKVYHGKNPNDNTRSILCNNIINTNSNCNTKTCNYYHDPYLGKYNDFHYDRQFSNNPIVFNNKDNLVVNNFKSGECVKENIKKIEWHEAITLYQSSLSNILISCLHSQKKV